MSTLNNLLDATQKAAQRAVDWGRSRYDSLRGASVSAGGQGASSPVGGSPGNVEYGSWDPAHAQAQAAMQAEYGPAPAGEPTVGSRISDWRKAAGLTPEANSALGGLRNIPSRLGSFGTSALSTASKWLGRASPLAIGADVVNESSKALDPTVNKGALLGRNALRYGGALLGSELGPVGVAGGYWLGNKVGNTIFGEDKSTGVIGKALGADQKGPADGSTPQPATQPQGGTSSDEDRAALAALPKGDMMYDPSKPNGGLRGAPPQVEAAPAAAAPDNPSGIRTSRDANGNLVFTNQPLGSSGPGSGYNQPSPITQPAPRGPNGAPAPAGAPSGAQSQAASQTDFGKSADEIRNAAATPLRDLPAYPGNPAPQVTREQIERGVFKPNFNQREQQVVAARNWRKSAPVLAEARGQDVQQRGQNLSALENLRSQDVQLENARRTRELEYNKINYQRGEDNRKKVRENTGDFIRSQMETEKPGVFSSTDAPTREAAKAELDRRTAEANSEINRSMADRKDGKRVEDLTPTEHEQLIDLYKTKQRVLKSRDSTFQTLRDLIGTNRFDSRNLYSFSVARDDKTKQVIPARRDRLQGGYRVQMQNGNTVNVKEVAGGKFVLLGSNEPVDADTLALLKPAIDAAKRQGN